MYPGVTQDARARGASVDGGAGVVEYGREFSPSRIGMMSESVADWTPGRVRMRSRTSSHAGRICIGICERCGRERESRGEDVVHVDAGIEGRKAKQRAAEHSGGNEQDERESDFGDDEDAVQAARASGDGAAADANRAFEISNGNAEGGSEAEEKTAGERNTDGEKEHACVEMNFFGAREAAGPERDEGVNSDGGNSESEKAAADAEDGAFGEALADEASAAGAESDAHGEFAFTGDGAREEQAGDIDAGDEEDEADGGEEQPER